MDNRNAVTSKKQLEMERGSLEFSMDFRILVIASWKT